MGAGMTCTSSTLLSETCLEKCRGKGVRKSYPGKTSSTDIFLLQHVGAQKEPTIAEGFRRNVRESDSIESSGTGLEGSCIVGVEENSGGSQPISRADDETGQTTLTVGRVTRFLSVDVPLTDIPERDSESERPEGVCDIEIRAPDSFRVGSVMERPAPAFTTDQYGTCQSDGDYGMGSSFYATASEGSAAPSESNDHSNTRRRRWASVDDPPIQSPKTKLIKNLRDTLETLKSETPTTGSSTTTALYETDRFVADLQALKDASTPDLRWLFDDAAAVLGTSPHSHAASSAGSSPTSRPRLASLHGRELVRSASRSKRDPEASQSPSLPATLSNICSPALPTDVTLIQHQFRERLMEEIKRLLEEIIDSHPEALEAIESVRQAKLARIAERRTVSSEGGDQCGNIKVPKDDQFMDEEDDGRSAGPSHTRGQCQGSMVEEPKLSSRKSVVAGEEETVVEDGSQTHDSSADSAYNKCMRRSNETSMVAVNSSSDAQYLRRNLALAELARRRNVHVARSHDDTSEGAVHYFQDTDGKWYTYAFNAEGVATAQLLGSDRALMELIAQQQEEAELRQSSQRKRRGRGKLTPSSRDGNTISGSATSARRPDPFQARGSRSGYSGTQRQGRVAPPAAARTVLARTGSSSSEESFLALDAPASIMHVGGVAGTCRTGAAALNISRAAGSLLPVEYAGGRVALPIRLHQHSSGSGQSSGLTAASAGANRRRSGATNSFVPLRHMLNRSGGTSTQFLSAAAPASVITRCRSGSLTSGRDAAGSFITAAASQQNADEQTTPGEYSTIGLSSSNFLAFSGSLRTPSDLSHSSLRARFFATLAGGVEGLPSMIGAAHAIGGTNPHGKLASNGSTAKRKQYYRVSLCPGFNARCCPTWLTSRLRAWKFWTQNGAGADTAAKSSGLTCCPKRTFKLSLDRLRLMAIFDRNRTKFSAFVDILLAVMVALVACGLLTRPLFYDLELVMACVVTAGAQFSLMKSVQPDASSPVHGYNALVAYSRPMYYCIFGTALYIFDRYLAYHPSNPYATETLYSSWRNKWECWWSTLKNFFATLFLFLPVVFTFGLLPQLDTFIIYILEQLEMLESLRNLCAALWAQEQGTAKLSYHKSATVRSACSQLMLRLVENMGAPKVLSSQPDFLEKVLITACQFANDNQPQPRYYGKAVLASLSKDPEFIRASARCLTESQQRTVLHVVDSVKLKGLGNALSNSGSSATLSLLSSSTSSYKGGRTVGRTGSVRRKAKLPDEAVDTFMAAEKELSSNSWEERFKGVNRVNQLSQSYAKTLCEDVKLLETYMTRLNDINGKVSAQALQCLPSVLANVAAHIGEVVRPVATEMVKSLSSQLPSKNDDIRSMAQQGLDCAVQYLGKIAERRKDEKSTQYCIDFSK